VDMVCSRNLDVETSPFHACGSAPWIKFFCRHLCLDKSLSSRNEAKIYNYVYLY
jgi:hypothetical protein